jgi:hypothetical protein
VEFVLLHVCKGAAARLNIEWLSSVRAQGPSSNLYDGKRLQSHTAPIQELSAVTREDKSLWDKPHTSMIIAKGTLNLDMHNMDDYWFGNPPTVELSLVHRLSPFAPFQ